MYDALIFATVVDVLAEEGIGALSARRVSVRAGVSQQAVQDRYADRSAMMVAAWRHAAFTPLHAQLQALLVAHGTLGAPLDLEAVREVWRPFALPDVAVRAGLELLLTVPYDGGLRAAVNATLGEIVMGWVHHDGRPPLRRLATQRAYLIGRALGLTLLGSIIDLRGVDMAWMEEAIVTAIGQPARAGRMEVTPLPFTLARQRFDTGDARRDALLDATTRCVARVGYHAATLEMIAAEAQTTKDVILSRYPSKIALFQEACQVRLQEALRMNRAWMEAINRRAGPGRGEAHYLRATMHPDLAQDRNLRSEELRVTLRDAGLREAFRQRLDSLLGPIPGANPLARAYA